jgi:glutamate transport system substrate-binding protein
MSVHDSSTDDWSGFDADLAQWLADEPPKFVRSPVPVKVAQREQALRGNVVDIVVGSYSITDSRRKLIGFAGPYMLTRQGVMVRVGDDQIKTLNDLQHEKVEVCTTKGSTSAEQLKTRNIKVTEEPGTQKCVDRLVHDRTVSAVSIDQLILYGFAKKYKDKVMVVPDLTFGAQEEYGVGLRSGSLKMCEEITQKLRALIVDGYWDRLFRNNFGEGFDLEPFKPEPDEMDACRS